MYEHLLTNPELARLVADLTSDGHLQIQGHRYIPSFYSKDIEEIRIVEKRFYNLFNIKGKIYIDKRPIKNNPKPVIRYKIFFISKPVTLFLHEIGTPVGNKTECSFFVPNWILNGNMELKKSYLNGLYDAEGSIFCSKGRWQITFKMAKNKEILHHGIAFFEQLREMLLEFGVKTSPVNFSKLNVRKDGSTSMYLRITIEKSSFGNFLKHIAFDNKSKQKKLLISLDQWQSG